MKRVRKRQLTLSLSSGRKGGSFKNGLDTSFVARRDKKLNKFRERGMKGSGFEL